MEDVPFKITSLHICPFDKLYLYLSMHTVDVDVIYISMSIFQGSTIVVYAKYNGENTIYILEHYWSILLAYANYVNEQN